MEAETRFGEPGVRNVNELALPFIAAEYEK